MGMPRKIFVSIMSLLAIFLFQLSYAAKSDPSDSTQDVITNAAQLAAEAQDPYAESLPMMIYAELGDQPHYQNTKNRMIELLNGLDINTDPALQWMQNNSFKAWMWGRILLAAQNIHDNSQVQAARSKLTGLLKQQPTAADNAAFTAWGWGYLAALNQETYQFSKKKMMDAAQS